MMEEKVCAKCKELLPITEFDYRHTRKIYMSRCRKCRSADQYVYQRKYPWSRTYKSITVRCNKKNKYGKKGIKNFLTIKDIKDLWFRDKGYLLKKPSIDRLDNNEHYTIDNCRFIEFSENSRLGSLYGWKLRREKASFG